MKRILLTILVAVVSLTVFGQVKVNGSLAPLAKVNKACLEIDFSEAVIHGMTEEEFALYEEDWDKDQPEIYRDLHQPMQEKLGSRLLLVKLVEQPYKIKVCVNTISTHGDFDCNVAVINDKGETIATINGIHAAGGRIGSALNLIKDGAESVGKKLGTILKREIIKIDKQR